LYELPSIPLIALVISFDDNRGYPTAGLRTSQS
jgi:hypothetical protein